jgi:replicative DNA helicase
MDNLHTTMYPREGMLKDSKTGKQGACDNILMIGYNPDPTEFRKRFISMPKYKNLRAGQMPCQAEVLFDGDKGLYIG